MTSARRPVCIVLLVALALGQAGCIAFESLAHGAAIGGAHLTSVCDRLYFGRTVPGGGEVTATQWTAFVATEIVPRFPQGFTTFEATGHWRGDDGAGVTEKSMVLEIVHAADPAIDSALDEIARLYRARFGQEAVLRVRSPAEHILLRR